MKNKQNNNLDDLEKTLNQTSEIMKDIDYEISEKINQMSSSEKFLELDKNINNIANSEKNNQSDMNQNSKDIEKSLNEMSETLEDIIN